MDDELLVEWNALTGDPRWSLVMEAASVKLKQAHYKCADPGLPEAQRLFAMGEVKAWSEIFNWRDQHADAYAQMREDADGRKQEAEDVGPEVSKQWYEHRETS